MEKLREPEDYKIESPKEPVESPREAKLAEPEDEPIESPRGATYEPFEQPGEKQDDTKHSAGTTSLREVKWNDTSPHDNYDEAQEDRKSVKKKLYLPIKDNAALKRQNDDNTVGDGNPTNE
jgi:hypothetical protein